MQKKGEDVAHAEDGIRLRKLKNSGRLRNSPPTASYRHKSEPNSALGFTFDGFRATLPLSVTRRLPQVTARPLLGHIKTRNR
jgi:hypothetical protein